MNTTPPEVVFLSFGLYNPPIHLHFRIFEIAKDNYEQAHKSKVLVGIVCPIRGKSFDEGEHVSFEHRKTMITLALKSSKWIELSNRDCNTHGCDDILDILQYHQNTINNTISGQLLDLPEKDQAVSYLRRNVQVKLIGGMDLLETFISITKQNPVKSERILENFGLIIVSKCSTTCEKIIFESDLLYKYKQNITLLTNWGCSEISSSLVRRLIGRKQSVKYLLDDSVIEFIYENSFYANCSKNPLEAQRNKSLCDLKNKYTDLESKKQTIHQQFTNEIKPSGQFSTRKYVNHINDFPEFLRFAIETHRIKAVCKEQSFV